MDKEGRDYIKNQIIKYYPTSSDDVALAASLNISLNSLRNRASRLGIKKLTVSNHIENHEKKCSMCKEIKPIWAFRRDKNQPNGYDYNCKECRANPRKAAPKTEIISVFEPQQDHDESMAFHIKKTHNPIIKVLNSEGQWVDGLKCKGNFCNHAEKPLSEFHKDKNNPSGHKNVCKFCIKERKKAAKAARK
ncbi:hypothetical protein ACV3YL_13605 [Clostridium perfringens]